MNEKKNNTEKLASLMHGAVDFGKKAASSAKNSVTAIAEKSKNDSYAKRLKKYNPLFPEQFKSNSFHIPNIIAIVDNSVRRDIDVCEDAIGWLSNNSDTEVLYLYNKAVDASGIKFIPSITCDAVYYVDNFDRNRYIRTDCIFSKAHEERLAELKHIAYSLGAKRCYIEISEISKDSKLHRKLADLSGGIKGISIKGNTEQETEEKHSSKIDGRIEVEFKGFRRPQKPTLKWFAHDDSINNLIDMCCNGKRGVKTETLQLIGSTSATMSQKAACAIDGVIGKLGSVKGRVSMNSQASKEHQSKLLFHIKF